MKRIALVIVSCFALIMPTLAFAQDDAAVAVADNADFGSILTTPDGMTLYLFTNDEPGKSNCNGDCAANWPPFDSESTTLPEGAAGELTRITRDDGSMQLAYNGWPLYLWVADTEAGQTTGQGVGGVWFVVEASDETTPAAMTEASPEASPVAAGGIMVGETDELGQFLTDADGMTLYIFSNDENGSGVSVCNDDCATNWPPFYVEDAALPEGVPGELTTITRDDGSEQLAYNGQPLYYFAADAAPGDTTGQAKGDVWWVASVGEP